TMVASPRDEPAALEALAEELSRNVNDGHVVGTNGPFLRIRLEAPSTGESASLELGDALLVRATDGRVTVRLGVQSPLWAEFDRIEWYVNATTERRIEARRTSAGEIALPRYRPDPTAVQTAGTDFEIRRVPVDGSVPGAERL